MGKKKSKKCKEKKERFIMANCKLLGYLYDVSNKDELVISKYIILNREESKVVFLDEKEFFHKMKSAEIYIFDISTYKSLVAGKITDDCKKEIRTKVVGISSYNYNLMRLGKVDIACLQYYCNSKFGVIFFTNNKRMLLNKLHDVFGVDIEDKIYSMGSNYCMLDLKFKHLKKFSEKYRVLFEVDYVFYQHYHVNREMDEQARQLVNLNRDLLEILGG